MAADDASAFRPNDLVQRLDQLDDRLRWLATWTIHNANHLRESRDGLKVGGHQASCASMTTLMTALYFRALRPQDLVGRVITLEEVGSVLPAMDTASATGMTLVDPRR